MEEVMSAVNLGAESIMDLSSHGDTREFRRKLTHECPAMIGTVPVYDRVIPYQRDLDTLTAKDFSVPLLCYTGRTFSASQCRGCEARNHCF